MKHQAQNRMIQPSHNRESLPLIGWRAIADHLNCAPATAQKWHKEAGLPVRRVGGTRIESTIREIDEWRAR